ncbi:MAG: ABC transporter ATP-binding protein [Rhizobiaceae bacterium]|nr:ABC transporter ATP-binding protein [Rhizobiaceae bacterium]
MEFLTLAGVSKSFGALKVTDDLDLSISARDTVGIIGPNGAGKTSLFGLISGNLRADTGTISFLGEDITRLAPAERCRRGIARSFQIPHPFVGMTVYENLLVGAIFGGGETENAASRRCRDILERTGLASKANQTAGSLRLLDRKRLEVARALATRPKLLLLDEIAGGLTEDECAALVQTVTDVREAGVAIIWIEHVVHALLAVVDRLVVLNFGSKVAEGEPHTIMASATVQQIYMGIDKHVASAA